MGLNQFSDFTPEEIEKMNGLDLSKENLKQIELNTVAACKRDPGLCSSDVDDHRKLSSFSNDLDWSQGHLNPTGRNVVGPVRLQGLCTNCWAIASTGQIEAK
jgi:hypothetical protein